MAELPAAETISLALEAIGDSDPERLRPLLDERVRVVTGRGVHEGVEAVLGWVTKRYTHLDRRYAVQRLTPVGEGYLGRARVQYVWRESGEVGDSSPIWLALRLNCGRLVELAFHEEEPAARAALAAGSE